MRWQDATESVVEDRRYSLPAHEESQIWTEAYALPETHVKMQKLTMEANKYQRALTALGNGEGICPFLFLKGTRIEK